MLDRWLLRAAQNADLAGTARTFVWCDDEQVVVAYFSLAPHELRREKTAQKHDYPSAKHRRSYARRSAVERSNSMLKSASGIDIDLKGWCQLMGLSPISLFLACACVVVNFELIDAFEARQAETARRAASGIPIVRRTRRRRRRTLAELAAGRPPPP